MGEWCALVTIGDPAPLAAKSDGTVPGDAFAPATWPIRAADRPSCSPRAPTNGERRPQTGTSGQSEISAADDP